MPGDPKECRQHALACVRLAQTSASQEAREEFANLARTWILKRTRAILDAEDDETRPEPDNTQRKCPERWSIGVCGSRKRPPEEGGCLMDLWRFYFSEGGPRSSEHCDKQTPNSRTCDGLDPRRRFRALASQPAPPVSSCRRFL